MESRAGGLPEGARVVADDRARLWRGGRTALGGAPWGVIRLGSAAADLLRRLAAAGNTGLVPSTSTERAAADRLVERGLAHPVPPSTAPAEARGSPAEGVPQVEVVVPAYDRAQLLVACLDSLAGLRVIVVDDASPTDDVARVARQRGARVIRHQLNRGPAAARNTGLDAATSELVAFVDADCVPRDGWLPPLVALFDDPRVAAVAPRVVPRAGRGSTSVLARHERARSSLDMGTERAIVRPGSRLGFLPSATLVVRREAMAANGFDEELRLGEDVDLVWRLADAGWHVRYEPSSTVEHATRLQPRAWLRRRFDYGTSAAALHARHPGRLAPARLSGWNLAAFTALVSGRPIAGVCLAGAATSLLARTLGTSEVERELAPLVVGMGLFADVIAVGHALRREWWPLGWLAVMMSRRSRLARAAAVSMILPLAWEWLRQRPDVDPARYTALRLIEDAAYGSGVIAGVVQARRPATLQPQIRIPLVDQLLARRSRG
jgi:mycofactocin system glycosyltransferase